MATLKEILDEENKILDLVISSGGELTESQEKELEAVMLALCQKADAYGVVMDGMEKRIEAFKMQADVFLTASKALKSSQERMKEMMKYLIEKSGKNSVEGNFSVFKLSPNKPSLVITEDLDPAYYMQVTETVPDKKRILEDIEMGVKVRGAFLKENMALRRTVKK